MTMKGDVMTVVRLPIAEIAGFVAEQNNITVPLAGYKLEKDSLVLSFAKLVAEAGESGSTDPLMVREVDETNPTELVHVSSRVRPNRRSPRRRKRHRMKTRGWEVVGMIKNSYRQSARVYRPFVDALSQKGLTMAQKRSIVAKILRSNGNRPTDSSIEYYLMNTIEFLNQAATKGEASSGRWNGSGEGYRDFGTTADWRERALNDRWWMAQAGGKSAFRLESLRGRI